MKPNLHQKSLHIWLHSTPSLSSASSSGESSPNPYFYPLISPEICQKLIRRGHKVTLELPPSYMIQNPSGPFRNGLHIEDYQRVFGLQFSSQPWLSSAPRGAWVVSPSIPRPREFSYTHEMSRKTTIQNQTRLIQAPSCQNHLFLGGSDCYSAHYADEVFHWFRAGRSSLFDIRSLVDANYRPIVNNSFFCGFVGAAIALKKFISMKKFYSLDNFEATRNGALVEESVLGWNSTSEVFEEVYKSVSSLSGQLQFPTVLILGAQGEAGRGARNLFQRLQIECRESDKSTESLLQGNDILMNVDILLNCVSMQEQSDPYLTSQQLLDCSQQRRLTVIGDLSCGVTHPNNVLPLYHQLTSFEKPFVYLTPATKSYFSNSGLESQSSGASISPTITPPLCLFALENLDGLVAEETRMSISEGLYELFLELESLNEETKEINTKVRRGLSPMWQRAFDLYQHFDQKYSSGPAA